MQATIGNGGDGDGGSGGGAGSGSKGVGGREGCMEADGGGLGKASSNSSGCVVVSTTNSHAREACVTYSRCQ